MAGRDYAWLLASVADELHRTDLTAKIADWVRLAESAINRKLNIYAKEIEVPVTTTALSRFIPLPADFGSPIELRSRDIDPRTNLIAAEASQLMVSAQAGIPSCWAVDGVNIAFDCPADKAYPLTFRYVQSLYLSVIAPSNPLLEKNPDLYLYGTLMHSAPYIMDDARLGTWKALFDDALRQVAAEASRAKSMAPLRTEIPGALMTSGATSRDWRS